MHPIVVTVVTILGKYTIDKGVELAKEIGPKAGEVAAQLFQKVVDRFSKNPADAKNLERFEKKPEDYKAPVGDALEEYLKDPAFAAEIKQLLAQYQAAVPAGAPGAATITQIAGDDAIQFGQVGGGTITISQNKPKRAK
jgi:hypothetical protein